MSAPVQSAPAAVRLFASAKSWIEGEAVRQLYATAKLPGMRQARASRICIGQGHARSGRRFVTEGILYPHLIGGDIGAAWRCSRRTSSCAMPSSTAVQDVLLHGTSVGTATSMPFAPSMGWRPRRSMNRYGTIGGGNHFAEVQAVEGNLDARALQAARARQTHSSWCSSTAARAGWANPSAQLHG